MKRLFTLAIAALFFTSCSDDNEPTETVNPQASGSTRITFDSRIGNADFALNKDFTVDNKTYNFRKLRYWVSNVSLIDDKGAEYKVPDSYYLIEEVGDMDLTGTINDNKNIYPAKKRESVDLTNIPAGTYKSIRFSIGVDQKYNDNLSLVAGELSIANGMSNISWMWHSSYIFSSLTGTVKDAGSTVAFKTETGLNANYKTLTVDLPAPADFSATKEVILNVDITKVFDGIDVAKNPTISALTPALMSTVAENYSAKAISFGSVVK
ncbi:hypothetical protein DSL64_27030 [Dyadobacter luteus]|uniref:Copper-binding protein MbnP-like domain-containing protein n=1 Tax=Dyadobacter luteus TaxID=2259619 RepID=A0A3D8Y6B5_9BACT|nr:MbnP family protein [Dyadobacter luteus]REA56351.1 hypothetical protein DSL64_27030 [Dyadobacter luteus]